MMVKWDANSIPLDDNYHMTVSAASYFVWLADHRWLALDSMAGM
jgi:hypothetical protein